MTKPNNRHWTMRRPFAYIPIVLLTVLAIGCSRQVEPKSTTLVLDYGELGPQVLVYELVGYSWFQWNSHGDSDPNSFDDVKIVIYRDIPLERVKQMYPVNKKELADHRYLEYQVAMDVLTKYENESHLENLSETKKKIIENLGS